MNERQIAEWNGESGARWRDNQARLDRILAPYGGALLEAAAPRSGERVLDVGCGAGATTLELARRVAPGGEVLGIDVSEPLVAIARKRAPGPDVGFLVADASRHPLPAKSFDLLVSRFGVMFFDRPDAAFAHLREALKPEGRLAFVCWRSTEENDWVKLPTEALTDVLPPPPPTDPEAPGPFSFGDRRRVARILADAGFVDVRMTPCDRPLPFGLGATREEAVEDALGLALQVGPLVRRLADQPEDLRDRAKAAVRARLDDRYAGGGVMIEGAAWIVVARPAA